MGRWRRSSSPAWPGRRTCSRRSATTSRPAGPWGGCPSSDVEVHAATVELPTRRAVTLLDPRGERTIITLGRRLDPPAELLEELLRGSGSPFDGIYFTAGGPEALRLAREAARVLTASPRAVHALGHGVPLDALILSNNDEYEVADRRPLRTRSGDGGEDRRLRRGQLHAPGW